MRVKRGDIYLADLSTTEGSEQGGVRPVLIIQNNLGNKKSPTTIVACITSKAFTKKALPTHFLLPEGIGLKETSIVMFEQIRVIDKTRLQKRIARLPKFYFRSMDTRIRISLAMSSNRKSYLKKQKNVRTEESNND